MRITGRVLRPSSLGERRILLTQFGTATLRVPRGVNPYIVARRIARVARGEIPDLLWVKETLKRPHRPKPPKPSPGGDQSEPSGSAPLADAAA